MTCTENASEYLPRLIPIISSNWGIAETTNFLWLLANKQVFLLAALLDARQDEEDTYEELFSGMLLYSY